MPNLAVTSLENRLLLSASISGAADPDAAWMLDAPISEGQNAVDQLAGDMSSANQTAPQWTDPVAFANEFNAWYQSQDFSANTEPVSVWLTPSSGTHAGLSVEVPEGIVLIIDGSSGGVRFTGASPALTVGAGEVIVRNGVAFETSTDDPTILVRATGSLTLEGSSIDESDMFAQSAITVLAGGDINLAGGNNVINVRGVGQLITLHADIELDLTNNTLQDNGQDLDTNSLADNFLIEDRITHSLDPLGNGLVTWVSGEIFVTQDSGDIQRGLSSAKSGDTIHLASGQYVYNGQLDVNASVTVMGAGQDQTVIKRLGQASGKELRTVQINAPDVTFQSLTFGGWTQVPLNANVGNGYLVWLNTAADGATFDDVRFDGDDIRVAIYLHQRNDFTVTNSLFTGTYFRAAIRGAGERMLISHNRFEESHYWYSPIYMEYGAPTSGEISFNYFVSRVGVNNTSQGFFKSDGTGLYAITNFQPNRTTAEGLRIVHNTFHFQDADLVNELGNQPIAEAIHIDPLLPASGPIEIRDNVFQGYAYTGSQPTGDPRWQPLGGIVDGALEFDGVDDFGWFVDPHLNIGNSGSLSLWVKLDEIGRQQTLIHGAMEVQIDSSNRIYFYTNKADGANQSLVRTNSLNNSQVQNLVVGQWHHVAITWDLTTKTGRIYVDGTEAPTGYSSGFGSLRPSWNNPNPTADRIFYVGSDPSSSSRWFNGFMDDIAFFDTALTAGQVAAITTGGVAGDSVAATGPSGNLVLHWTLDQSTDRIAVSTVRNVNLNVVPNGVPLGATDTALWRDGQGIDFGAGPTGALEFDGLSNFATFSDPDLNIGTNGSMTMWVKVDSFGRQQALMHGALEVQIDASRRIYFYANKANSGNVNDTLVRSAALSSSLAGTWMHIAITWDLGNKTGRIYVNGAEVGYSSFLPSRPNWNVPNPTAGEVFFLGNDPTAATWGTGRRFLDGLMDDVALFDTTLTQPQIGLLRSNGVSETFAPVAHWNFDVDQINGIYSGVSATTIPLELYREPPPAPIFGYAINASANTVVTNNVFFENDIDYNPIVKDVGDNLFGDPVFNLLRTVPDPAQPDYQVGFGAMATYSSSEYLADSFTLTPHVGAYQGNPGLFGSGDLIVRGSAADDLLVISEIVRDDLTGLYTAEARYVRGVGGPNEVTLEPILLVDLTGVTFNGELGDDHFIIINPTDRVFTPSKGITFNGGTGGENSLGGNTPGDLLELRGGVTDTVSYDIVNGLDGFISYNGILAISYSGVEPIIDTIVADHRNFVWRNLAGEIRLLDEPIAGLQRFEYDTDQQLQFQVPTKSLAITHLGMGDQKIKVLSLDSNFVGDLALVNTGDVILATQVDIGGGLIIDANNVTLNESIKTAGEIAITAGNDLLVEANIDAADALILFLVNQDSNEETQGFIQSAGTTIRTSNATAGALEINVAGTGDAMLATIDIGGGLIVNANNVTLKESITTAGPISITASNTLLVNATIDAANAAIKFLVNQDGAGTEGFTQLSGTTIRTTNATDQAVVVNVAGAGNATLSIIKTGTSSPLAQVTLVIGGSIISGGPINVPTITTSKLLMSAGSGIGAPNASFRTDVEFLQASSTNGYIWVREKDDLVLQGISATGTISSGHPQIVIESLAGAISILSGTVVRSSTGQVNNIPPRLRLEQVDPADALLPGDPTQEVVGTIGGIESLGEQLEVGNHFKIAVRWDDGIVSVLDFPTDAKVLATVTGLPAEPILQAGDSVVWLIDENNLSTATIVRGPIAEGPIQITIERTYPLIYLQMLRQPEVVASFDLFNDSNIFLSGATQGSLNQSDRIIIVTPVAEELIRPSVAITLVEPPVIVEESRQSAIIDLIPAPPSQTIVYDDSGSLQEEEDEAVSRIFLVRVLPSGEEGEQVNLSLSELRDLSGLLNRLKTAPIPNGLYRIYYQEAGLPSQQLLEFRKAGRMIGDPVLEPGRGSNAVEIEGAVPGAVPAEPGIDDSVAIPKDADLSKSDPIVLFSRFAVKSSVDESPSLSRVARQIRRWNL